MTANEKAKRIRGVLESRGIPASDDLVGALVEATKAHRTPSGKRVQYKEDPAVAELISQFSKLLIRPAPAPVTERDWQEYHLFWKRPLTELVQVANGHAAYCLTQAVERMRKDSLTISTPKSVLAVALGVWSEQAPKLTRPRAASDPFAALEAYVNA